MKKYLIKGLLALFGGAFLASCTDHDVEYVPIAQQKTQAYDQAFKEMIGGDVDPNQNWGFEGIAIPDDLGLDSEAAARAMTRGHNADANMWVDYGWTVPPELTERQKLRVKLYFQYNPWLTYQDPHLTNFFVQQVYKGGTSPIESQSKEVYPTGNGDSVTGSSQMDLLTVGTPTAGSGQHYYDHVNNFNYGRYSDENPDDSNGKRRDNVQNSANVTYNYDNGNGTHRDHIMLMVGSKTDCVGFWSSNGSVGHNDRCALVGAKTIDDWATSAEAQALGITDLGDAVYDSNPKENPDAKRISVVTEVSDELIKGAGGAGSALGTGGMQTKILAMSMLMDHGIAGVIAEGSQSQILEDILDGEDIGTLFVPHK